MNTNSDRKDPKAWSHRPNVYQKCRYDTLERYNSYWYQLNIIIGQRISTLLEVGPGNHFLATQLRRMSVKVTTLDTLKGNHPNVCGDVLCLPLANSCVDCVTAFQVLEHIPWSAFDSCLAEMARVSRKIVVISLPDQHLYFRLRWELGVRSQPTTMKLLLTAPWAFKPSVSPDNPHYWVLGRAGFTVRKVLKAIEGRLQVIDHFRIFENPYHHFFICAV